MLGHCALRPARRRWPIWSPRVPSGSGVWADGEAGSGLSDQHHPGSPGARRAGHPAAVPGERAPRPRPAAPRDPVDPVAPGLRRAAAVPRLPGRSRQPVVQLDPAGWRQRADPRAGDRLPAQGARAPAEARAALEARARQHAAAARAVLPPRPGRARLARRRGAPRPDACGRRRRARFPQSGRTRARGPARAPGRRLQRGFQAAARRVRPDLARPRQVLRRGARGDGAVRGHRGEPAAARARVRRGRRGPADARARARCAQRALHAAARLRPRSGVSGTIATSPRSSACAR